MKLYKKIKQEFVNIDDYSTLKVGDLVKVYSTKSNKFVTKKPLFVINICSNKIIIQSMDSNTKEESNIDDGTLKLLL